MVCLGDVVAAWKALKERLDGNTKEARCACREKVFTTMPSGGDPTDFISTMDDLQLRLADMGEQILDDTYADLLLNSFPKEFAFIRQMNHRDRSSRWSKSRKPPSTFTSTSFRGSRRHLLSLDVEQQWRPRPAAISTTSAKLSVTTNVIALGLQR